MEANIPLKTPPQTLAVRAPTSSIRTTNQLIRRTQLRSAQSSGAAPIQLAELEQGEGGKRGHMLVLWEHLSACIIVAKPGQSVKVIWFYIWWNSGSKSWNALSQGVQSASKNVSNENTDLPPWVQLSAREPGTQTANMINFFSSVGPVEPLYLNTEIGELNSTLLSIFFTVGMRLCSYAHQQGKGQKKPQTIPCRQSFQLVEKSLSTKTFHIAWELLFPLDNKKNEASQGSPSKTQTRNI